MARPLHRERQEGWNTMELARQTWIAALGSSLSLFAGCQGMAPRAASVPQAPRAPAAASPFYDLREAPGSPMVQAARQARVSPAVRTKPAARVAKPASPSTRRDLAPVAPPRPERVLPQESLAAAKPEAKSKREELCQGQGWNPVRPTQDPITDHFGWSAWRGRNHDGVDYGVGVGTTVVAAESGVVTHVGFDGGYGNYVILLHGNGYMTTYNHLSQASVKVGQKVCRGDKIALSGKSGKGTGPHLHFEVWVPGDCSMPVVGKRCSVNPLKWIQS